MSLRVFLAFSVLLLGTLLLVSRGIPSLSPPLVVLSDRSGTSLTAANGLSADYRVAPNQRTF